MKIAIIAGIVSLAASVGAATAEEPSPAPADAPQSTTSCVMNVKKDGMQCYLYKECITQTYDPTTGNYSWTTSSERVGGPIPCMPSF